MSKEDKKITIHIDREVFHVEKETMTGKEIKTLGNIRDDYDLFQVIPGEDNDPVITDDQVVTLKSGMKFIGGPTDLNPGSN